MRNKRAQLRLPVAAAALGAAALAAVAPAAANGHHGKQHHHGSKPVYVSLNGSAVAPSDGSAAELDLRATVSAAGVPTHYLAAFGPSTAEAGPGCDRYQETAAAPTSRAPARRAQ